MRVAIPAPSNLQRRNIFYKTGKGETMSKFLIGASQISTQTHRNHNLSLIASTLLQQQGSREIHQLELIKFYGDPSDYANFMYTRKLTVDVANVDVTKKLYYIWFNISNTKLND